ncbi:acyltransferase [Streptomyces sp. NPDC001568]|uniref:acyltransferase family protein n=1 Tax=Streptomyces sp. NPDC001568 TaxID=3364588 RepID=UPI0036BB7EF6
MLRLSARWSALAERFDRATPADRNRPVDALRALAILGVVLGHWLVTALTTTAEGGLRTTSPLAHQPWPAPLSWVFQTLAVFFLVGGHVAARGHASARARGIPYGTWVGQRLGRLFRPVAAVLGLWGLAAGGMLLGGAQVDTVMTLLELVWSPLWFLLVFAVLTAATPLVARLSPVWPAAVVLAVDAWRFGFGGPEWIGWVNVAAGWLVPYTLGAAWSRGAYAGRRPALLLCSGGAAATVALVVWCGYPASMVGVPGAAVSNLNPPTLAAVAFGLAQCGLVLLLRAPLDRALRRPRVWAVVALVNLSAMTVFLWHQTSMMAVTAVGLLFSSDVPGLHTTPASASWVVARLLWLPVFAAALAVCWAAFRCYEHPRPTRRHRARPTAAAVGGADLAPSPVRAAALRQAPATVPVPGPRGVRVRPTAVEEITHA